MNRYAGRKSEDKIDYLYILLAFALSVTFFILLLAKKNSNEDDLLYDYNIYFYASILSFIIYSYQKSFRLCRFLIIILIIYFLRNKIL
jgi:hypothetical protein